MIHIISQKHYLNGHELMYECWIDDIDLIHFTCGKSNGITSDQFYPMINTIENELIIDFQKLRNIILQLNNKLYNHELIDCDNEVKLNNMLISKKFLNESFNILKNMWIDD